MDESQALAVEIGTTQRRTINGTGPHSDRVPMRGSILAQIKISVVRSHAERCERQGHVYEDGACRYCMYMEA